MNIARRACAVALGVALSVPLGISPVASASPDLLVDYDGVGAGAVRGADLRNEGTAAVDGDVLTNAAGSGRAVGGSKAGRSGFVRLPVSNRSDGPQAVLRFTPTGTADPLLPGRRPFVFGAEVRLLGAQGSEADQGNNVIQRGRFVGGQYKLQADRGRASCRVAGDRGAVMLQDTQLLRRSAWYRLQCDVERLTAGSDVARVRLTVVDVAIGAVRQSRSAWTRIGPVTPAKHALLVGGVTPSGTRGNDQLEGDVDRLIVDVT